MDLIEAIFTRQSISNVEPDPIPQTLIEKLLSAAVAQNILLSTHALGLGAKWRSGPAAYDPEVKKFLGFEPDQHVIAFLYLGFLKKDWITPDRPAYGDHAVWRT